MTSSITIDYSTNKFILFQYEKDINTHSNTYYILL